MKKIKAIKEMTKFKIEHFQIGKITYSICKTKHNRLSSVSLDTDLQMIIYFIQLFYLMWKENASA